QGCSAGQEGTCVGNSICLNSTLIADETCANLNNPTNAGTTINIRDEAASSLPGIPDSYDPDNAGAAFGSWIANLLNIVVIIAVLLVFFYLLWGAFEWITSGGDSGKLTSARGRI